MGGIRFCLCGCRSENHFVCFGARPTERAWGRFLLQDRKWRREGRSLRKLRKPVDKEGLKRTVSRREQKRLVDRTGQSRAVDRTGQSAFLVALWKFRTNTYSLLLRLELTQGRVCSFVLFFHPLDCVLCVRKEMCNAPTGSEMRKNPLDESLASSSFV